MDDRIVQKQKLLEIFRVPTFAPLFKQNPIYCINHFAAQTPYISYADILNNKFIIRGSSVGSKTTSTIKSGTIIIEYEHLDKLVEDGWRLEGHL